MNGVADALLEEFSDTLEPNDTFHDECLDGNLIVGYQTTYSSGGYAIQIRFLCSVPGDSSMCGKLWLLQCQLRTQHCATLMPNP